MTVYDKLQTLKAAQGKVLTSGLGKETVMSFIDSDPMLTTAIENALTQFDFVKKLYPDLIDMDEADQIAYIQNSYINFYAGDAINPYVALAAKGPWVITLKGAVLHDNGGYGMLGAGHAPDYVLKTLAKPHVMANIMTANVYHTRLTELLTTAYGSNRSERPYIHIQCKYYRSEAV